MQTLLTIAGFDPTSGAGVTADLNVFDAYGFHGAACITALTVQSTLGVRGSHPVSDDLLRATLECVETDLEPAGIKVGMLATAGVVAEVAAYLRGVRAHRRVVVVLDPVLKSSSGRELLDPGGIVMLQEQLLPLVDWVTPNRVELEALTGEPVANREEALRGAERLAARFAGLGVLVTGGEEVPPDDLVLGAGEEPVWLPGVHVATTSTHGTGCALSSALLCGLVKGRGGQEAAKGAKDYVAEALRRAVRIGHGRGPIDHLWPLRRDS